MSDTTCPYCDRDVEVEENCEHLFCQDDDLRTEKLARVAQCLDLVYAINELAGEDDDFLPSQAREFMDSYDDRLLSLYCCSTWEVGPVLSGYYTLVWCEDPAAFADEIRKILQSKYAEAVRKADPRSP